MKIEQIKQIESDWLEYAKKEELFKKAKFNKQQIGLQRQQIWNCFGIDSISKRHLDKGRH